jgi:hypothetical protein
MLEECTGLIRALYRDVTQGNIKVIRNALGFHYLLQPFVVFVYLKYCIMIELCKIYIVH